MGREPARDRRVLITGGAGLVGRHLVRDRPPQAAVSVTWRSTLPPAGVPAHQVELTDSASVRELFERERPDVVVHTAYSQADRRDVVDATEHLARACAATGAALVHLSSDVVFDGESPPYDEDDPVEPVNDHGRWKAAAERAASELVADVCVVRLSLVVSSDPPDSGTRWLLDEVSAGRVPTLFHDEIRCPIRVEDLVAQLWALVALDRAERAGIWHLPGPEAISRVELGRRVLAAAGLDPSIPAVGSSRDHPQPRARDVTMASRRRAPGPVPTPVP